MFGESTLDFFNLVNLTNFVRRPYGMVWYGNILFDIVHNIIENILPKHKNM